MKRVRTIELTHAVSLDGRGHRSNQTLLYLSERDNFLRVARDRFCVGMSDRAAAAMLHVKLARYRDGIVLGRARSRRCREGERGATAARSIELHHETACRLLG